MIFEKTPVLGVLCVKNSFCIKFFCSAGNIGKNKNVVKMALFKIVPIKYTVLDFCESREVIET